MLQVAINGWEMRGSIDNLWLFGGDKMITTSIIKRVMFLALLLPMVCSRPTMAAEMTRELEPYDGVFQTGFYECDSKKYLKLRDVLLSEHSFWRNCQIVAVPSLKEAPWVVYWTKGTIGPPYVVFKTVNVREWFDGTFEKASESTGTSISESTADLLERVWDAILLRVRYPEPKVHGLDGTWYYVSHSGRSGRVWSPYPSTPAEAFIRFAEVDLRDYARAGDPWRQCKIAESARDMLARLKK